MKKNKENKIDWFLISLYVIIGMLVFMTGMNVGIEQYGNAICHFMWTIASVMTLRNYLLSKKIKQEMDSDIKGLSHLLLLWKILSKNEENKSHEKPMSSAEVNEETEMVHVGEGVGDE